MYTQHVLVLRVAQKLLALAGEVKIAARVLLRILESQCVYIDVVLPSLLHLLQASASRSLQLNQ